MSLIKKLQECTSIEEANPILTKLKARPSARKLVETAIILSNSDDPQQKDHAFQFMTTAIQEMEDDDKKKPDAIEETNDDEEHVKENDKVELPIHEEELDNHNNGSREEGSEQSTQNVEPYPGTADDSANGEKPMQDMDGTVNQWNETGPPGMPGQMPPVMPGQIPMGQIPGLDPGIAQEVGMVMPNIPPLDTNQMMRQMQYTVDKMVSPLRKQLQNQNNLIKQQREAIKSLSIEIRETKVHNKSMTLDIDSMRKNANASFRETIDTPVNPQSDSPMYMGKAMSGLQPQHTIKKDQLEMARNEIAEMDKIIRSENSTIYG